MHYQLTPKGRLGKQKANQTLTRSAFYQFLRRKQLCIFDNMNLFEIEQGVGYTYMKDGLRPMNVTRREYYYLVPKHLLTGRETIEEFEAKIAYEVIMVD